jgi:hypothetical protein
MRPFAIGCRDEALFQAASSFCRVMIPFPAEIIQIDHSRLFQ